MRTKCIGMCTDEGNFMYSKLKDIYNEWSSDDIDMNVPSNDAFVYSIFSPLGMTMVNKKFLEVVDIIKNMEV